MNKKLLIISILAVFMLMAISFASAVNTSTTVKRKESPLFGIRTRRAVTEKVGEVIDNIKAKYIGERVFFLPFQWFKINSDVLVRQQIQRKTQSDTKLCGTACMSYCDTLACSGCNLLNH